MVRKRILILFTFSLLLIVCSIRSPRVLAASMTDEEVEATLQGIADKILSQENYATDYEKLDAVMQYVTSNYTYRAEYDSDEYRYEHDCYTFQGTLASGGGDCWGLSALVVQICTRVGIPAHIRYAANDKNAGSGHRNVAALCDGEVYLAEPSIQGILPRSYTIDLLKDGFTVVDNQPTVIRQYDGFDSDIRIPDWVTSIGGKLWVVFSPGEVISGVPVKSIYIPASVKEISCSSFMDCSSFTHFDVDPDNPFFTSVDGVLYTKDMKKIISYPRGKAGESFEIPEGVEILGEGCFYGSTLASIDIPDTVTEIQSSAMRKCEALLSLDIPDTVEEMGDSVMLGCTGLKTIHIPDTITELKDSLLQDCESLESFEISTSVKTIGKDVFYGCYKIEDLHIPSTVEKVHLSAFRDVSCLFFEGENTEIEGTEYRLTTTLVFLMEGAPIESYVSLPTKPTKGYELCTLEELKTREKIDLSGAEITGLDLCYQKNGYYNVEPVFSVILDGQKLKKDINYEVKYLNNNRAGTATVEVNGIGRYQGTVQAAFEIFLESQITEIESDDDISYKVLSYENLKKGEDEDTLSKESFVRFLESDLELYYKGKKLCYRADYEETYENWGFAAYSSGKVNFTLKFCKRCKGDNLKFYVDLNGMSKWVIEDIPDQDYTGQEIRPTIKIVEPVLMVKTDTIYMNPISEKLYTVSYENNVEPGTAVAKVNIAAKYCIYGELTKTFQIISPEKEPEESEKPAEESASPAPTESAKPTEESEPPVSESISPAPTETPKEEELRTEEPTESEKPAEESEPPVSESISPAPTKTPKEEELRTEEPTESEKPAGESEKPAEESTKPVEESAPPVSESISPAPTETPKEEELRTEEPEESEKPAEESEKLAEESAKPVEESELPVSESISPAPTETPKEEELRTEEPTESEKPAGESEKSAEEEPGESKRPIAEKSAESEKPAVASPTPTETTKTEISETGTDSAEEDLSVQMPEPGTVWKTGDGTQYTILAGQQVSYKRPSSKKVTKVVIPEYISINGVSYKVVAIEKKAFFGCAKLKSVTIGKYIYKIGQKAFYNCKKLKLITIKSKKIKKNQIGTKAFKGIYSKARLKVPVSLKSYYRKILIKKGAGKGIIVK